MGNTQSIKKINYEDMQTIIKNPEVYLIINTLLPGEQQCLIVNTTLANDEEIIINKFMKENKSIRIIIYGKNCNDENVNKKYFIIFLFILEVCLNGYCCKIFTEKIYFQQQKRN